MKIVYVVLSPQTKKILKIYIDQRLTFRFPDLQHEFKEKIRFVLISGGDEIWILIPFNYYEVRFLLAKLRLDYVLRFRGSQNKIDNLSSLPATVDATVIESVRRK